MSTLTIATTTFYPNTESIRFHLASRFIKDAISAEHRVVVVDDSPDETVAEKFRNLGATVFKQTAKGMGPGRREAIQKAFLIEKIAHSVLPVVAWVEPEKYPIVPFLGDLCCKMKAFEADLIVPRRKSLVGYPKYQQLSELRGNWEVGNHTGRPDLDLWIGPRLIGNRALKLFVEYDGQYGDKWDSIFIPVARAIALGLNVRSEIVDYIHPAEQTEAEVNDPVMDRKRDEQLETLLAAMREESKKLGLSR